MHETDCITTELLRILNNDMGLPVASPDTDLFETGILDSLALVNLLLHIETRFNVTVALKQLNLDSFRSVGAIAGFITAHRPNADPPRSVCASEHKAAGSPITE
ncbi:MAG: acyl carrier protein [Gammaproteobacteria bacterium]